MGQERAPSGDPPRGPGRYGGAWGIGAVLAIVVGWVFLLGSVLLPGSHHLFPFCVGVGFCSCGFLMEFLLWSPPIKAD